MMIGGIILSIIGLVLILTHHGFLGIIFIIIGVILFAIIAAQGARVR